MRWIFDEGDLLPLFVLEDDEVLLGQPFDGPSLGVLHVDVLNDQSG